MRKILTPALLGLLFLTPFSSPQAKSAPDFYNQGYESVDLSFLRSHYEKIDNGRRIRVEGWFKAYEWQPLYEYQQRLKDVNLNHREFNVAKLSLRETGPDDVRYAFPVILCRAIKGDLSEFKSLKEGQRLAVYGTFFNLKKSDWALVVDVVEAIDRGGFEKYLVSDYRMAPTPTPTATITPTPGPGLFKRMMDKINPKESPVPSGTVTPETTPEAVSASASPAIKAPVHRKKGVIRKTAKHKSTYRRAHKSVRRAPKPISSPAPTPAP